MNGITAVVDVEADWDNYVETWINNGGREIMAELENPLKLKIYVVGV
ncbi:hypothetical protein ACTQ54_01270 [Fundicoccus sp. Sow4_H7]